MEKKSGISQRSVLGILHQHKFHPCRMSLHQDLYGNDFLKRVNFRNWIRKKMRTDTHFWVMCFFLIKLTSQIWEMWIGVICIIGRMRILDRWEQYHFNIRCPLIVGATVSATTSLVHILLKVAWLVRFTQTFCKTRLLFMGFFQRTRFGGSTYHAQRHERKNQPSMYRNYTTNVGWS